MKDKELFLTKFKDSRGIVKYACEKAGISRQTFYRWMKEDEEFFKLVKDIEEDSIDFVENKLLENIENNKTQEIIFYLSRKAKHRGYVERQEIQTDSLPQKIEIQIIDENTNKEQ